MGGFIGDPAWCAAKLEERLAKRIANLDNVDRLIDTESITNAGQLQYHMQRFGASKLVGYFCRLMPPDETADAAAAVDDRIRLSFERLVAADHSPAWLREVAWDQAQLPSRMGGFSLAGNMHTRASAHAASFLGCWPLLQRTSPVFAAQRLDPLAPASPDAPRPLPMLKVVRGLYSQLQGDRAAIDLHYQSVHEEHHTRRGGKLLRFRPKDLPPAKALPPLSKLFTIDEKTKSPVTPPSQRKLASIVHHSSWATVYSTLGSVDGSAAASASRVRNREAARFIAVSQPASGAHLDMPTDGTQATQFDTPDFIINAQYRLGLHISEVTAANDALEAAGERVDRKGDELANKGEFNRRHNNTLRAVADAERAPTHGQVVLGDKETPAKTDMFNVGHVVDIAITGNPDTCLEVKVPSPLTTGHSRGGGAKPPDVGDRYGFGNTEEFYRILTLGCKAQGRGDDPPFDPATGKGRVAAVRGHYHDALLVKRNRVVVWLVESTGGIAPQPLARLRRLARLAKVRGARDGTQYGLSRRSPRSYLTHHTQRISAAATRSNAKNMRAQANCLKQRAYRLI